MRPSCAATLMPVTAEEPFSTTRPRPNRRRVDVPADQEDCRKANPLGNYRRLRVPAALHVSEED